MFQFHKICRININVKSLLVAASLGFGLFAQAQSFKAMNYNVQNLFDTVDSPDTNDVEFTPNGKQKWTNTLLNDKIANLNQVIKAEAPDFVGLCEIENQAVVDMLMNQGLKAQGFVVGIAGPSQDARGIRCGIVSKFPVVSTNSHKVWKDSWKGNNGYVQKTRDIFEATLDMTSLLKQSALGANNRQLVTVLVNHWPSRAGGPERDTMRVEVAEAMAEITANILQKEPTRLVISLGDFNDELSNNSFRKGLNLVKNPSELATAPLGSFYATDEEIAHLPDEQKGTYFYGKESKWNTLDHVLIAKGRGLFSPKTSGFDYRAKSIQVVHPRKFMTKGVYPSGCEISNAGRKGNRCLEGASDHLPQTAVFDFVSN